MTNNCTQCKGRGEEQHGYGSQNVCDNCLGTGKELTVKQRRMVEGILKMLSVRLGRGFQ